MTRYSSAGRTHVGMKRSNNEDAYTIRPDLSLYIVADGMGGHSSGEIASKLAVRKIVDLFEDASFDPEDIWPYEYEDGLSPQAKRLKTAIALANEELQDYSAMHPESRGMGTTVIAALTDGERVILSHVGDSRAYLLRKGTLEIMTMDHSWVNEQVRMGYLTDAEAQRHPFRNVITRALGTTGETASDIKELKTEPGDLFMLCTDGLITMISDEAIAEKLGATN
ncbi:MAG: protein phosphatase 2C domain-containing protein, partial [Acidobacteriota bacterium]